MAGEVAALTSTPMRASASARAFFAPASSTILAKSPKKAAPASCAEASESASSVSRSNRRMRIASKRVSLVGKCR